MTFKKNITAIVEKIHPEAIAKNGKVVREIDVIVPAQGRTHTQHYQLTEVSQDPRELKEGYMYSFTVFVNGLKSHNHHVNKLLITQVNTL